MKEMKEYNKIVKKPIEQVEEIIEEPVVEKEPEVKIGIVSPAKLNVRADHDKGSDVVAVVDEGTEVTIFEDLGEWLHVSVNGLDGYVMSEFIK